MSHKISMKMIPALLLAALSGTAGASGFAIQNQTGSGTGNAFAGAAATAEDAGTVYFNPAGMTYLPQGHSISVSGTLLYRSIEFDNKGSVSPINPVVFPLPTGDGGDAGGLAVLPAGYWVYGISPNLSVGLGFSPTFGNTTEYKFDFVGRNAGYFFEMEQLNLNPSIAYKVNEMVSLGAGINFAYNKSHFKQGVVRAVGGGFTPNNYLDVEGDDWAVGYNLGVMFQVSPSTRIGLVYRSELKFDLEGEQEYAAPNVPFLVDEDIKATLKTPAYFSLAVSQKLSDQWELLGDVTWTDWSVVKTLEVESKASGRTLHQLPYNFEDTWRVGLGANYQYSDVWKFRFGVAYDQTPVRHSTDRTMTLPDSDRTWLSFGAKYSFSKVASLDVGYSHVFFADATTNRDVPFGPIPNAQIIRGTFKTSADYLSVQYNHSF